jgi:hypothetical protein
VRRPLHRSPSRPGRVQAGRADASPAGEEPRTRTTPDASSRTPARRGESSVCSAQPSAGSSPRNRPSTGLRRGPADPSGVGGIAWNEGGRPRTSRSLTWRSGVDDERCCFVSNAARCGESLISSAQPTADRRSSARIRPGVGGHRRGRLEGGQPCALVLIADVAFGRGRRAVLLGVERRQVWRVLGQLRPAERRPPVLGEEPAGRRRDRLERGLTYALVPIADVAFGCGGLTVLLRVERPPRVASP